MVEPHDHYVNARNLAIDILRNEKLKTQDRIRDVADRAIQAQKLFDPTAEVSIDQLSAELRHLFSVTAEAGTVLEDSVDHLPWYPARRASIAWRFWNRYVTFLERDFGMAPTVVTNLDELTSMILERLEDPGREGQWDRRGMVVGSVQSGKTANYTGLICKAIDAGYKLVIILAGIHSNLRAQTQLRIDEGVLGFDTQKNRRLNPDNRWIGVGKLPGERLVVHSLTSSAENGDFNKNIADQIGVMLGGDPVVLVVKKNSALLRNLLKWVLHVHGHEDATSGKRLVNGVPLLLIDDEADNASINTKAKPGSDVDTVTAINGGIRHLLDAFQKSAYVGYTATPFANIFINPEIESPVHGLDLFPRSFIINVKPPSNYVGPSKVFGLSGDPDAGIAAADGLPIIEEIDDFAAAFPPKHKKDHVPAELPQSLRLAIRCFVLTCAARRARGQGNKHNSMLIHVTRFVNVQEHVVELVRQEVAGLKKRIEFGDGQRRPTLRDELRGLWETEFIPKSIAMGEDAGPETSWSAVDSELHAAAAKITVMPINGYAKEALDYREHEEDGLNVIAIGGDKLSRGLTLEGLSISYFLRTTRMYDTLMQMGRWFGYRPGYLDLCRLFTTRLLRSWYRHIALAEVELRREFDYMVDAGLTPENYGLRVRTHPAGMIVTALNKMSHGRTLELSWAGVLSQTTHLPKDPDRVHANVLSTEKLLREAGKLAIVSARQTRVWRDVDAEKVASYIDALRFPPAAARATGEQLAAFIRKQSSKQPAELTNWTVALISNSKSPVDRHRTLAGFPIGLMERSPESQTRHSLGLKKANILSPTDEALDFDGQSFSAEWYGAVSAKLELHDDKDWLAAQIGKDAGEVALDLTRRWQSTPTPKIRKPPSGEPSRANGRVLRSLRRERDGLLLIYPIMPPTMVEMNNKMEEATGLDANGPPIIGIALSFPVSATTLGIEYRVNTVWGSEISEDDEYED
jgi:hypothetical protein